MNVILQFHKYLTRMVGPVLVLKQYSQFCMPFYYAAGSLHILLPSPYGHYCRHTGHLHTRLWADLRQIYDNLSPIIKTATTDDVLNFICYGVWEMDRAPPISERKTCLTPFFGNRMGFGLITCFMYVSTDTCFTDIFKFHQLMVIKL